MDLETIFCGLPKTFINKDGKTVGLFIRYKVSEEKWVCAYGFNGGIKNIHKKLDYIGVGETPFEAVENFIEKMRKWNKAG